MALSLALTIPMAMFAAVRAVERSERERAILADRSVRSASRAAQLIDDDISRARLLIAGASRLIDPRAPTAVNDSLLRSIFGDVSAGFSNIWVTDTLGRTRGSLIPVPDTAASAIAQRPYVREALASRSFVIGQPVESRIDPRQAWVIPFVQPVIDTRDGRMLGLVGAGLKVDRLSAILFVRDLPPNSVLTVLRGDGRVFLRSRDLASWIGRNFYDSTMARGQHKIVGGMNQVESLDGTVRLVAQDTLTQLDATVYVGIPVSESLSLVQQQLSRDVGLAIVLTLLMAATALFVANRITTPLEEVADVATALAHGARDRRAKISGNDEVAAVGRAMNAMADAVRDREQELEESEARYRQLFETSPLPTLTWRLNDGRIDRVNDAARAFYGQSQLAREDLRILDLIAEEDRERFSSIPLPPSGETIHAGTWTQRGADSTERIVEWYVGRLERTQQTFAVGVLLDVTERRRAERALELSREQLRQAQQLESLGAFAGGIAHDFNNYLSAIATNAELLGDELPEGSPLREEANEILHSAQRASHLTRQILVFSRRQIVQEHALDVAREVKAMQHLLGKLVSDRVQLTIDCREPLARIRLSRERLEQVLMNLCANARDAMPEGGRLAIVVEMISSERLGITVSDTGSGIPAELRTRIFEPFFTTKPRERGTGLGLSMVHSIITSARGSIDVSDNAAGGTTFSIELPALTDASAEGTLQIDHARQSLRGREHVLVVEDDASVRSATASLLARAGYQVSTAASASEAMAHLAAADRCPDIMLTDVVMPNESGPDLVKRARARYPSLRVVYMSGYADNDDVMRGLAENAIELVAKPFSAGELLSAIRRVLDALV